jgi:hypothetical protein
MTDTIKYLYQVLGEVKSDIMEINQSLGRPLSERSSFQRGTLNGIEIAICRLKEREKERA